MMKEICVVHLVRAQNEIESLECFLESYRQNPGGIDHDMLVVFKGFNSQDEKLEHLKLLAPYRYCMVDVSDAGFDITAYFAAAMQYSSDYRYFCFLNSFSVIQDIKWLSKLYNQISQPAVGLVGATGSWQSHRRSGAFWPLIGMVDAAIRYFRLHNEKSIWKRLKLSAAAGCQHVRFLWDINPFPNYHLRTNAFMIPSELMQKIKWHAINSKMDAYRFESGRNGLTKQILKMGKAIRVVGKNGIGYEMGRWSESRTFWQSEQENLLVADNQTRDYQYGSIEWRKRLSRLAWGKGQHLYSDVK